MIEINPDHLKYVHDTTYCLLYRESVTRVVITWFSECLEPAYEGRYLSLHVFWSYSPILGKCVQKTFGGPSPPGRNHFDSLEDCKETCVD